MKLVLVTIAPALLAAASVAAAHPGHNSLMMGTLKAVAEESITLEFRDPATLQLRRVKIVVNADTKLRVGKEPIESIDTMIGAHVAVSVNHEEGPNGEYYLATEVRFDKPKDTGKSY